MQSRFVVPLQVNGTLQELHVSWNKLKAKGCTAVAQGLQDNVALRVLSMAWCGMQDVGTAALATMLSENDVSQACIALEP